MRNSSDKPRSGCQLFIPGITGGGTLRFVRKMKGWRWHTLTLPAKISKVSYSIRPGSLTIQFAPEKLQRTPIGKYFLSSNHHFSEASCEASGVLGWIDPSKVQQSNGMLRGLLTGRKFKEGSWNPFEQTWSSKQKTHPKYCSSVSPLALFFIIFLEKTCCTFNEEEKHGTDRWGKCVSFFWPENIGATPPWGSGITQSFTQYEMSSIGPGVVTSDLTLTSHLLDGTGFIQSMQYSSCMSTRQVIWVL